MGRPGKFLFELPLSCGRGDFDRHVSRQIKLKKAGSVAYSPTNQTGGWAIKERVLSHSRHFNEVVCSVVLAGAEKKLTTGDGSWF